MAVIVPIIRESNDDALEAAIQIAKSQDVPLVAVLSRPVEEFDEQKLSEEIDALSDRLDREDIAYSTEVRLGEEGIAKAIAEAASDVDASLVVVSLAQRPANGKLLLGSQIQRLLVDSPCSVLVVRQGLLPTAAE